MPFQLANVKRMRNGARATFDLILQEQNSELTLQGCALVKSKLGRFAVSFTEASVSDSVAALIAAKAAQAS
jgi:hypothetical protein